MDMTVEGMQGLTEEVRIAEGGSGGGGGSRRRPVDSEELAVGTWGFVTQVEMKSEGKGREDDRWGSMNRQTGFFVRGFEF